MENASPPDAKMRLDFETVEFVADFSRYRSRSRSERGNVK
jgi:hypothetical protein